MTSSQRKIRWGILGPGTIAKAFAGGVAHSRTGTLVALGARNPGKAGLAETFPGARILDGYDALLTDPEVDAMLDKAGTTTDNWRSARRPALASGALTDATFCAKIA